MPVVSCPRCSTCLKVDDDLDSDDRIKCTECGKRFLPPHRGKEEEESLSKWSRIAPFAFVAFFTFVVFVYLGGVLTGWLMTRTSHRPAQQETVSAPVPQLIDPKIDRPPPNHEPERTLPPANPNPDATEPKKPKPPADQPPPAQETLTASALMKNFFGSNSGSLAWYGGKWLEVSGTVADLRFDVGNVVIVQLDGGNPWRKVVRCTMRPSQAEAAKKLLNGHTVVIRGRCDGCTKPASSVAGDTVVDVLLGDCYVIKSQ